MAHRYKGYFHKKGGLKIKRVGLNHTAHYAQCAQCTCMYIVATFDILHNTLFIFERKICDVYFQTTDVRVAEDPFANTPVVFSLRREKGTFGDITVVYQVS